MTKPTIPAFLYSVPVAILPIAIGMVAYSKVGKSEEIKVLTQQIIQWSTVLVTIIVWLAVYCYQLHKAFDLKSTRREKIAKWRSDLDSSWGSSDFISSSFYQELRPHLSNETVGEVENAASDVAKWEVLRHSLDIREVSHSKILVLKDIGRLEKVWGLI